MGEDSSYIVDNAPNGATHYGRYSTGKLFYALEYRVQGKSNYLTWFDFQCAWHLVENTNEIKPLI